MNAYEFIKDIYPFYLLTISNGQPQGRPFGAIYFENGSYFVATGNGGNVYNQINACPSVQIVALKHGTRNWIRISGKASLCNNLDIKQNMLSACPVLTKHYKSATDEKFAMFEIKPCSIDYHGENGLEKLL